MFLPSFHEATRKKTSADALRLAAKYVDGRNDLAACCAVSREWHEIFSDVLWENPLRWIISHQKLEQLVYRLNGQYSALNARIQIIDSRQRWLRATDTLSEMRYQDADQAMERSLNYMAPRFPAFSATAGAPFSSESCAEGLEGKTMAVLFRMMSSKPVEGLRYCILDSFYRRGLPIGFGRYMWLHGSSERLPLVLSLQGCFLILDIDTCRRQNPSPRPLKNVRYLDLSHSSWRASRLDGFKRIRLQDWGILDRLVVLKLRNCGLTDEDVAVLRRSQLGHGQLGCLDLRNNRLTDDCVADLSKLLVRLLPERGNIFPLPCEVLIESSPHYEDTVDNLDYPEEYHIYPNAATIPDDVDDFIAWAKLSDLDTMRNGGLRQLYLSGNRFSFVANKLLWIRSVLQTFDCDVSANLYAKEDWFDDNDRWMAHLTAELKSYMERPSPIPLVVALCSQHHAPRLERLTMHHTVVTYTPERIKTSHPGFSPYDSLHNLYDGQRTFHNPWSFLPETNNGISYLELVGIPVFADIWILKSLEFFLKSASIQEHKLRKARSQRPHGRRAPRVLRGLRKLVLVLTNVPDTETASVTEDKDAEQFLRESENDFSFFEDEKGKGKAKLPMAPAKKNRLVDIRAGIAAYRKATRAAYKEQVVIARKDLSTSFIAAPHFHWSGELVVVWPREEPSM